MVDRPRSHEKSRCKDIVHMWEVQEQKTVAKKSDLCGGNKRSAEEAAQEPIKQAPPSELDLAVVEAPHNH